MGRVNDGKGPWSALSKGNRFNCCCEPNNRSTSQKDTPIISRGRILRREFLSQAVLLFFLFTICATFFLHLGRNVFFLNLKQTSSSTYIYLEIFVFFICMNFTIISH